MTERLEQVLPLRRPERLGKYELVEKLGRGGMAEVWKARINGPAGFSRVVVIKRILSHLCDDLGFVRMFIAEAQLSSRLQHPNIIDVFELGQADGEYYIAMEYVRGLEASSFRERHLATRGLLPPGLAALVIADVCHALAYAHELKAEDGTPLGIVHRDVSPSNVMLGVDGRVKLLDFGIAKALHSTGEKTRTGTLKGKVAYIAPEQVSGQGLDHRADLFSAGVVLHELLTGQRLFRGANELETLWLVREANVAPPSATTPGVPPDLDAITMRALARDPGDRYQTAAAMAADLEAVAQRLNVRRGHLAASVRALFPEEPAANDRQPAPEPANEPTRLAVGGAAIVPTLPQGSVPLLRLGTAETVPAIVSPPTGARRRALLLGGLLSGLGVSAALLLGGSRTATPEPPPPVVAAPQAQLQPALPPPKKVAMPATELEAPELPHMVRVQVASNPLGAEVFLDGEAMPRGRTPLTLEVAQAATSSTLRLVAPRYRPMTTEFMPTGDRMVQVVLTRAGAPQPMPRPRRIVAAQPGPRPLK